MVASPHETYISRSILEHLAPLESYLDFEQLEVKGCGQFLRFTLEEVADAYFNSIKTIPYCWFPTENAQVFYYLIREGRIFEKRNGVIIVCMLLTIRVW